MKLIKKTTDMLQGPIFKTILVFALPIFLGNVFQQFYNMVDSIVVGKYVSANALAAVGSTSTLAYLLVGIMMGFPTGAAVVAAQFLGAGQKDKIRKTIATTLYCLLVLAVIITAAGILLARPLMSLIQIPDEILEDTILYFRIYIGGVVFMALYNFYAAFLRAMGDSTTPLIFLIISSLLNIGGDLFTVLVLHMGVAGVATATVVAQAVSVLLCFLYVSRNNEYFRFQKGEMAFDREIFGSILRLGIPSSVQSSVSGLGMVAVQGLINSFGAVSIAAYTAASKMEGLCNLPMSAVSASLSMFVGQNVGAGQWKRTKKGLYASAAVAVGISACMSVFIYFTGEWIMQLFVKAEEIEVIRVGADFMRIWAPLILFHALFECFAATLRGAGDSVATMLSMFFDLCVRAAMAYVFALGCGLGFMGIARAIPCGWISCSAFTVIRYYTGGWKKHAVVTTSFPEGEV